MNGSTLGLGIAAGLVSALLLAAVAKATPLALVLFLVAPLPILLVSLGWNHRAGLVGTVAGAAATALLLSPLNGVAFAVGTALPAWWLGYLILLGRPGPGGVEWYPLGRLLVWIAILAAATILATALISSNDYADFRKHARDVAEGFFGPAQGRDARLPQLDPATRELLLDRFATLAPLFAAQGFALLMVLYAYASARIVAVSGRLPRPWPVLSEARMPRGALLLLLGALALGSTGGFPGAFGLALFGALGMTFALQGLAFIHHVTRRLAGRMPLLIGLYLFIALSQGAVLVLLALVGLADTALNLRGRRPLPPGPQPLP
jgi:hypothetical protein